MQLIAVRHGQSAFNLLGLCNDDPACRVELTPLGIEQANSAARELQGYTVDRIYSSPLRRAEHTAQIISGVIDVPLIIEPRISDIHSGCDGLPVADYLAAIAHDPVNARVGDGESLADYAAWVRGFLRELASQAVSCAVLVAHEETLRIIQATCECQALSAVAGRPFDNCHPYFFELSNAN